MDEQKHIVPYKIFIIIWILLLFLTFVTVLVSRINLGYFNILVAMIVATSKAALVVLFFMHLKYEDKLFKVMVFISFLVLGIFISFSFFDVAFR